MTTRMLIVAAVFVGVSGNALAETIYCSESFQGYRVCDDGHGHRSTEWQWHGTIIGSDSDGNHWTSSRWRDGTITTVAPR